MLRSLDIVILGVILGSMLGQVFLILVLVQSFKIFITVILELLCIPVPFPLMVVLVPDVVAHVSYILQHALLYILRVIFPLVMYAVRNILYLLLLLLFLWFLCDVSYIVIYCWPLNTLLLYSVIMVVFVWFSIFNILCSCQFNLCLIVI